jgi:RNA ligase
MDYEFPTITMLDDVLPHIKDRPEFIIAERDFGYVVNYTHVTADTFPPLAGPHDHANAILRECRGLIFDNARRIISRPYHKFFNVNERPETSLDQLYYQLSGHHKILEKLDGSMVRPLVFPDGNVRLATKMGITDTAMQAEVFLAKNPHYLDFIKACEHQGLTPIFEWCSTKNKVVLEYPKDRLVLTAIRYMYVGKYMSYDLVLDMANNLKIDVVKEYDATIQSIESLIQDIRDKEKIEGFVLRFNTGHMVKVKSDWYVSLHKTKDAVREEKNVLELIVNEQLDDLIPLLDPEDKARVIAYRDQVWNRINFVSDLYESKVLLAKAKQIDRKTFALEYANTFKVPSLAFDIYGEKYDNAMSAIVAYVKRNCGSRKSLIKVHDLLGKLYYQEAPEE